MPKHLPHLLLSLRYIIKRMDVTQLGTSPLINWLRIILLSANFLVICAQLPLSIAHCWLQLHTSLIHRNLKCILLAQSACFNAYGITRGIQIWVVFLTGPEHLLDGKFLQFSLMFNIEFVNAIGHVLFLERLLATWLYKKYENYKNPSFTIIWLFVVCLYSGYNAYAQMFQSDDPNDVLHITFSIVISASLWAALAFMEIIIISIIGTLNVKKYKYQLRFQSQHNLSERFQISENIQTARQLGPTFICHFLELMFSTSYPLLLFSGLIRDPILMEMWSQICFLIASSFNFCIEYTIISRHPILCRNAQQLLTSLKPKRLLRAQNKVENSSSMIKLSTISNSNQQQQENIRQRIQTEEHFKMLCQEWECTMPTSTTNLQ